MARVKVIRTLATSAGAAAGRVTLSSRSRRLAPNTRHTCSRPGCTSRMPVAVFTNTMKYTNRAAMMTFGRVPRPNQRMNSGASAILGIE